MTALNGKDATSQAGSSPLDQTRRITELDGLRGIAIGTVLLYHYMVREAVGQLPGMWRIGTLAELGQFGWIGVDIFFALSGFLIGGILLDSRGATNYFRVFYIRRAYRILPLYVALCLLAAAVWLSGVTRGTDTHAWLFEDRLPWYAYATFAQNLWMAKMGAMGSRMIDATWSLAIEEQFYLVLPLIIWRIRAELIPRVIVGGLLLAPALRVITLATVDPAWRGNAVYLLTYCRMDALLIGVLVAWLWRDAACKRVISERRGSLFIVSATLGAVVLWMDAAGWRFHTVALMSWGLSVVALWCGTLVLLAISQPESHFGRILRMRWLGALGGIAYAVYLFHQPVLGLLHMAVRKATPGLVDSGALAVTIGAAACVIGLARLSWRYLEGPMVRRGRQHQYQQQRDERHRITA